MKINEINIDGFGKLHNFHMEFKNGFNIIYGNNEDGKSTVMAFIKMMFYGSPPLDESRILIKNPRKKYLPKSKIKMGGNIIFENQNKTYRLEREFKNSNSEDEIKLFNITDNNNMRIPDRITIGQMFFGFSASAFEKTFFINQTGTALRNDDEINQRLANLNSAGDESISLLKVRKRLISAKQVFKSAGGNTGKLDRRYAKLREFEEMLENEKKNDKEKASMLKKSEELSTKIRIYEETYRTAVEKIDIQEKLIRLERLQNIAVYHRTYDDLNLKLIEKQSCLVSGNFTADNEFIEGCNNFLDEIKNLEQKKNNFQSEHDRIQNELKIYESGVMIEEEKRHIDEINNKISGLSLESDNIDEEIEKIRNAINSTEEKLKNSEIDFHISENKFKSVEEIYNNRILSAEKELREASMPKPLEKDSEALRKREENLNINVKMLVFSVFVLFGSLWASYTINHSFIFAIVLAVLIAVKSLNINKNKNIDKPFEYVNQLEIIKYTEALQKVRNSAANEKSSIEEDMENAKIRISDLKATILKLKNKITEFQKNKKEVDESIVTLQQKKSHHEIKIAEINASIKAKQEQVKYILSNINITQESQDNTINKLLQYFSKYKDVKDMEEFEQKFNELKRDFQDIEKIKIQIESHVRSAPPQNENFSLNQVYMQIKNLENMLISQNEGQIPEKLDDAQLEKTKEQTAKVLNAINSYKEDYANINATMKMKFKDSKGISHIEHEMSIIKSEIEENEQFCTNIDTALKYINESADEIHKNFGSALNLKTAETFKRLTGGKYDSVTVSSDFNIEVKNATDTIEWQYLSNGTIDQAYFSLRLAVAYMLSSDKKNSMPVLIDDVFIQYDDIRTKQALDFLDDFSVDSQVIFFTCHSHLIDMSVNNGLNAKITKIS